MNSTLNDARRGLGFLLRGLAFLARKPRLAALGMVPPLIVWSVMVSLLIALAVFGLAPITDAVTGWVPESFRLVARVVIGIIIMLSAVIVGVIAFSSVTLLIGGPIYDRISASVEAWHGGPIGASAEPALAGALRGIRQTLAVIGISALCGGAVLLLGIIPAIGGVAGAVVGAVAAGYLLTLELISGPFDRWGVRSLAGKFGALRRRRMLALGFGVPLFLVFSLPLMAVILFPAATAGATLLARELQRDPPATLAENTS